MEADHLRVVVGDLKTQMLDIEERRLPWVRRLNQNVCSKVVCHVRPLMIESSPCGCSIHLAKEERLTRIVAGSDDGANHRKEPVGQRSCYTQKSTLNSRSPFACADTNADTRSSKNK